MADEAEPFDSAPVKPLIPRDHLEPPGRAVDRKLQHVDSIMRQLDLALAVAAQLMQRHEPPLTSIVLDSFALENGPRVTIAPDKVGCEMQDKHYYVQIRPAKAGS